jgi:hypothetical protein
MQMEAGFWARITGRGNRFEVSIHALAKSAAAGTSAL